MSEHHEWDVNVDMHSQEKEEPLDPATLHAAVVAILRAGARAAPDPRMLYEALAIALVGEALAMRDERCPREELLQILHGAIDHHAEHLLPVHVDSIGTIIRDERRRYLAEKANGCVPTA